MTEHYYSKQPQSDQKIATIDCRLRNQPFQFLTSSGVFSKKGVDFGTRLLIETFRAPNIDGDILDLGCGYGAIGIALAKSYPDRHITMVDINERAVTLAGKNAERHDATNVTMMQSDGFEQLAGRSFAAILTNPPIRTGKKTVQRLLRESMNYLIDHGELWIVVQKKQGAPSMQQFLSEIYAEVEVVARKKGYYIIKATNRNKN